MTRAVSQNLRHRPRSRCESILHFAGCVAHRQLTCPRTCVTTTSDDDGHRPTSAWVFGAFLRERIASPCTVSLPRAVRNHAESRRRQQDQRSGARLRDQRSGARPRDQRSGARLRDQCSGARPRDQRSGARPRDQCSGARPRDRRSGAGTEISAAAPTHRRRLPHRRVGRNRARR